ncbi:MAG: hypothetical protein KDK27_08570 [Leptospiraceae bacterium]|nr:hypothetical protein [Leptospiraceae bacterium]
MRSFTLRLAVILPLCFLGLLRPATADPSCGRDGVPINGIARPAGMDTYMYFGPDYSSDTPSPMIIVFHGTVDISNLLFQIYSETIENSTDRIWRNAIVIGPMAQEHGLWYEGARQYAPEVDALLEFMHRHYNIDRDRVYAAGWSAGAVFLGNYSYLRQTVFAGAVFHEGGGLFGVSGAQVSDRCKLPVFFQVGANDFMMPQIERHRSFLAARGHAVVFHAEAGREHGMATWPSSGITPFEWMRNHTLCGSLQPGRCEAQPVTEQSLHAQYRYLLSIMGPHLEGHIKSYGTGFAEVVRVLTVAPELEELTLLNLPDDVMQYIPKMENLTELSIEAQAMGEQGLSASKQFKGQGLRFLAGSKIRRLNLSNLTEMDSDRLLHLKQMPELKELWLSDIQLNEGSIDHLGQLSGLRRLVISGSGLDEGQLNRLKSLLSETEVFLR